MNRPFLNHCRWALAAVLLIAALHRTNAAEIAGATGITEPFHDVTISASVPGIITERKFKEGDAVKSGDVIIELDRKLEELETARRKLLMDQKKTDLDSTRILFGNTKSVSKEELEKKEAEYKVAAAEHDIAAEQLRRRMIATPIAGTVTDLFLHAGEACQPYQPLVRVVDTQHCYFVSNLEAKLATRLSVGQTINLEVETGGAPLRVEGKIIFVSPVVDPASGLVKVRATFDNLGGKVRPGLSGKLLLP